MERKHKHILNVSRYLIFQPWFPLKYWGNVILTSVFLIIRIPSSVLKGLSPYELVYKKCTNFDNLRVFGCLCSSKNLNNSDKFSAKDEKCVFWYSLEKKGYKVLSLDSNSIFISRDVKFYDAVFPFKMQSPIFGKSNENSCEVDMFSYYELV